MKFLFLILMTFFAFSCDRHEVPEKEVVTPEEIQEERLQERYLQKDYLDEDDVPAGNEDTDVESGEEIFQ